MSAWILVGDRLPPDGKVTRCLIAVHYGHAVEERHKNTVCLGEFDPWSKSWSWPSTATGGLYGEDDYPDYRVVAWLPLDVLPPIPGLAMLETER